MRTRVSVAIATAMFGLLSSSDVFSQSRFGRAAVQLVANEEPEQHRDRERAYRPAKSRLATAVHRQSARNDRSLHNDRKPKLTSRHFHSGNNTLRLVSAEATEFAGEGEYEVIDQGREFEHVDKGHEFEHVHKGHEFEHVHKGHEFEHVGRGCSTSTPHDFLEPQPWSDCDAGGDCVSSCEACGIQPCRCRRAKYAVFADALYLRPGNVDLVYSEERTGCDPLLDSPTGQLGTVAPDFELGLRFGIATALDNFTTAFTAITKFESHTVDAVVATGNNVLNSRVTHPNTGICAANSLFANAQYDIDFDLIDIGFARGLRQDYNSVFRALGGFRYAHLEQEFLSQQTVNAGLGTTTVATDLDFDGLGVSLGFDGESRGCRGLTVYGRGIASFVGGEFKADYRETSQFGGAAAVVSDYEDYRLMSILEAEVGVGWQSKSGRLSVHGGYQVMGWLEAITTADFINAVHQSAFNDLGDLVTFSGLILRAEARF